MTPRQSADRETRVSAASAVAAGVPTERMHMSTPPITSGNMLGLPSASSGIQLAVASPSPGGVDTPVTPIASPEQALATSVDGGGVEAAASVRETQVPAANAAADSGAISAAVAAVGKGAKKGKGKKKKVKNGKNGRLPTYKWSTVRKR